MRRNPKWYWSLTCYASAVLQQSNLLVSNSQKSKTGELRKYNIEKGGPRPCANISHRQIQVKNWTAPAANSCLKSILALGMSIHLQTLICVFIGQRNTKAVASICLQPKFSEICSQFITFNFLTASEYCGKKALIHCWRDRRNKTKRLFSRISPHFEEWKKQE